MMLFLHEIYCSFRICLSPLDYVVGVARSGHVTSLTLLKGNMSVKIVNASQIAHSVVEFCPLSDCEC